MCVDAGVLSLLEQGAPQGREPGTIQLWGRPGSAAGGAGFGLLSPGAQAHVPELMFS